MSTIHFFKLNSRIGLLNAPHRQERPNIGVENGPAAILSKDFLEELTEKTQAANTRIEVDEFTFPTPDNLTINSQQEVLAKYLKGASEVITRKRQNDEKQVCIGGDHSITFSSLLSLLKRVPASEIGYIQIDSHGDSNTFASSPTGNFHGMFLRPFFADFDSPPIEELITEKLTPEQIIFIGNLDLDPAEIDLFKQKNIRVIDQIMLQLNQPQAFTTLTTFINRYKYIHVSLDIDAFDRSIAPATGIPAFNGLLKEDVWTLLQLLFKHKNVSLDLVEVNPQKEGAPLTLDLAREIVKLYVVSGIEYFV